MTYRNRNIDWARQDRAVERMLQSPRIQELRDTALYLGIRIHDTIQENA